MHVQLPPGFMTFDQFKERCEAEPREWLIEDLLATGDLVLLSGPAKVGKSHLALNLVLALNTGSEFLGRPTSGPRRVLVIQLEIQASTYRDRVETILAAMETSVIEQSFFISTSPIRLDKDEHLDVLETIVREHHIDLVVIDPFAHCHRGDENAASGMRPILDRILALSHEHHCAVVLVHHQGKPGEHTGKRTGHKHRGSSVFADVPDSSWVMSATNEGATLSFETRNIACPSPMAIKLGEDLVWRPTGELPKVDTNKRRLAKEWIVRLLGEGPTPKQGLIQALSEEGTRFGTRTAEAALADLVTEGIVSSRPDGKRTIYTLLERSQDRGAYSERGNADVGGSSENRVSPE